MNLKNNESINGCEIFENIELSLIVVAFNNQRELPRTIYTLSSKYQQDINPLSYEIIIVDNGSKTPLLVDEFLDLQAWNGQIRIIRIDDAEPSPVAAINMGLAAAKGAHIGVMIDGARMCTPKILARALQAGNAISNAVVGALGWYLGHDFQRQSMLNGYDQAKEDELLNSIEWKTDGYLLYNIACMDESSIDGWFSPIAELNAIFMHKKMWGLLKGYELQFDLPGGGLANLDLCKRALELEESQFVLLDGEATFHQFHGGTATNSVQKKAILDWEVWHAQYVSIRGVEYSLPKLKNPVIHFGDLPMQMRIHYFRALAFPSQKNGKNKHALGENFDPKNWAMPEHIWNINGFDSSEKKYVEVSNLLRHELRQENYTDVVIACRWLCAKMPDWLAVKNLLALISPWCKHTSEYDADSDLMHSIKRIFQNFDISKRSSDLNVKKVFTRGIIMNEKNCIFEKKEQMENNLYIENSFLNSVLFIEPYHFTHPAPWAGHIPFASWLISVQKPRVFVELGTYSGISYLSFCQSIKAQSTQTRAWAVDTWQGDAHAGIYDESIYQSICKAHDPHYTSFSTLLRMTFDEALNYFEDSSVDLLHIDGLHTYEAVKHDFESWLPKISDSGVVIFHDTNVYRDDFGVHQLWEELTKIYPNIHFPHSNGLGVLLVGKKQPKALQEICDVSNDSLIQEKVKDLFSVLGARLELRAELQVTNLQLQDSLKRENHLQEAGLKRHNWIEKLDKDIIELQLENNHEKSAYKNLVENFEFLNDELGSVQKILMLKQQEIEDVYASRSWRITSGLRKIFKIINGFKYNLEKFSLLCFNGLKYIKRGDIAGFKSRVNNIIKENKKKNSVSLDACTDIQVGIMATPHTKYVANLIKKSLDKVGVRSAIIENSISKFDLEFYFVICPQMFEKLPPGEKRISFQMEQGVSSRWFTDKYIKDLNESFAVFDYSETNFSILKDKGISYPHAFFTPVGGYVNYLEFLDFTKSDIDSTESDFDILFYGDSSVERRQKLISKLSEHFNIRVENNLFGRDLHALILKSKIVVNIHYYEGALLETTRIYECLSLGVPVVSESSTDIDKHTELLKTGAVEVTPIGDIDALISKIKNKLEFIKKYPEESLQQCQLATRQGQEKFDFMFYRALFALKLIDKNNFEKATRDLLLSGNRLVLSMPETIDRRNYFIENTYGRMTDAQIFDGVRYLPGWRGCALSYQFLARKALDQGFKRLEILEDDVCLPDNYEERRQIILEWLNENEGEWDVFLGLIAKIHPQSKIISVRKYKGQLIIVMDRMMSMVNNIYSEKSLIELSKWEFSNSQADNNTIDMHMQKNKNIRACVTLPFLVNHAENLQSSLWGINNEQYKDMINCAEKNLYEMVESFESSQNNI